MRSDSVTWSFGALGPIFTHATVEVESSKTVSSATARSPWAGVRRPEIISLRIGQRYIVNDAKGILLPLARKGSEPGGALLVTSGLSPVTNGRERPA
jgi:hypothetical protein